MNKFDDQKRIKLVITGIVQGVGFRPTVYQYAHRFSLGGFVNNTSQGVFIEVEGTCADVDTFVDELRRHPPPQAQIDEFHVEAIPLKNETTFIIVTSDSLGDKNVEISPDLATCSDCLAELRDPSNRRYRYPFINCTNCGPRFTIIHDRPYDRPLTSMRHFPMCPTCLAEYTQPLDRRFHAQPNACPVCGPRLSLLGAEGDPLATAVHQLQQGKLVAIKGLGGFNIAAISRSIDRLRMVKRRPHKAFALMMRDIETIERYCVVSENEREMLQSASAPIVLLRKRNTLLDSISPDTHNLGVMLPYTPLHHLLFDEIDALIMTSANRADEPIATEDAEIDVLLRDGIVDLALTHNRPIVHRADDSIVQWIDDHSQVIRRSRGFVPRSLPSPFSSEALGLGANLKNTFALSKHHRIYLSQHIGDLMDVRNFDFQKNERESFATLLDIHPHDRIGDQHPGYETFSESSYQVQHHHAHALSAMIEHDLLGQEVFAVIADGTGYGTDGGIWGFEFLHIPKDWHRFERCAHLRPFHLPGGEAAIRDISRIATALTGKGRTDIIQLIQSGVNAPLCSSLGRLFDGVASILNLTQDSEYEGRGAMLLQTCAENTADRPSWRYTPGLDWRPMISEIVRDLPRRDQRSIAWAFHQWVVDTIIQELPASATTVVFSGGCFQNTLIVHLLKEALRSTPHRVFFQSTIPCNDAGIALGQMAFSYDAT